MQKTSFMFMNDFVCVYIKIYRFDCNSFCIVLLQKNLTSIFLLHNAVLSECCDNLLWKASSLDKLILKNYTFFHKLFFLCVWGRMGFFYLLWFLIPKRNLSKPTNNCFLGFIFIILLNPTLKQFKNPLKASQIKNLTWIYIICIYFF